MHESHVAAKIAHLLAKAFPIKGLDGHKIICSEEDLNLLFEKVHLGISANMGIYFISCLWLVLLHWIIYKHWIRIDYEAFDYRAYQRLKQSHEQLPLLIRWIHLPNRYKLWNFHGIDRIHALRGSCIEQYNLPSEFQYSKYLKFAMRDVVIHVLEVHPICWAMLLVALLLTFGRNFLGLRVNDSLVTLMLYGGLSLLVAAFSLGVFIYAAIIYRRVLRMPSVRAYLHSSDAAYDSSFEPHESAVSMSTQYSNDHFDASSPLLGSGHRKSHGRSSGSSGSSSNFAQLGAVSDADDTMFDTTAWHGRTLPFQIFSEDGHADDAPITLMSVDKYREYSSRVRHILKRVATPTDEDNDHKSALIFRSRRLIIAALQIITFAQTWLLGLSIYYIYSIYVDTPRDPLKYPILNVFPFIGPLLTYGLMGPTLSKIVKATYTGGLVRADLLLEALFLPPSRSHPNAKKKRRNRKNGHHDDDIDYHSEHDDHRHVDLDGNSDETPKYPSSSVHKERTLQSPSSQLPLPKNNCNALDSDVSGSQSPPITDTESEAEVVSDYEYHNDPDFSVRLTNTTATTESPVDPHLILN